MDKARRPFSAKLIALLLALGGLATGYVGLSAYGYLVPAAVLLLLATLLWQGRGRRFVIATATLNLFSQLLLDGVLLLGGGLGPLKLDIAGSALLLNIASGGPALFALSIPLLLTLFLSSRLRQWMDTESPARI